MSIPQGYRLLTSADVGKVFGVDLELEVYFDTSATFNLLFGTTSQNTILLTNFLRFLQYGGAVTGVYNKIEYTIESASQSYVESATQTSGTVITTNLKNTIATSSAFQLKSLLFRDGLRITSYNTDYNWNNWFYVKDKSDPYNITSSKPKITINCKNKLMTKDLTIIRELWDGSYEEIVSGYTVTLNCSEEILNNPTLTYSLNNGDTWNQFSNPAFNTSIITLQNVSQIKFKNDSSYLLYVGTTPNDWDLGSISGGKETSNIIVNSNTTLYLKLLGGGSGD